MKEKVVFKFEQFHLDAKERLLLCKDKPLRLTPKAFDMLLVLVEADGRLVTKQELMKTVWPGLHVDDHNVKVTIATLRKALGPDQNGNHYIKTVPKEGYRLGAIVMRSVDPTAPESSKQPPEEIDARLGKAGSERVFPTSVKEPISPKRGIRWRHFVFPASAITLMVAVVVGGVFVSRVAHPPSFPTQIEFKANSIQAWDDGGHLLWTHTFSMPLDPEHLKHSETLKNMVRFADLKGIGEHNVLVTIPLRIGSNPSDALSTEIDYFSSSGQLLWSYLPREKLQFGNYELDGPWVVGDVFVSSASKPMIWVDLMHYRWGNSLVVQLDSSTGKSTLRLVNTGIINKLNEVYISGKPYLLAGGFNNEYESGSLAIMDESRSFSASPQTVGTRHECLNCPPGGPDYYFVFPRSEINRLRNLWENFVRQIDVHGDEISVSKEEILGGVAGAAAQSPPIFMYYNFVAGQPRQSFSFRFDSTYDLLHHALEESHQLNHPLGRCPERLHPDPIRLWTPADGWTQVPLKAVRPVD